MTREEIQAELAAIGLELTKSARAGVARSRESELRRAQLIRRKAELEAALPSAPSAAQFTPEQKAIFGVEAELGALNRRAKLLLEQRPGNFSEEERVGKEMETVADHIAELKNRMATLCHRHRQHQRQ